MFSFCKKPSESQSSGRMVDVGWLIDAEKSTLIWDGPRKISRPPERGTHAKSVNFCPATLDHDARLFEVPCPVDINIACQLEGEAPKLVNLSGDQSSIRTKHLTQLCHLVPRNEWRHPNRPVFQILTPYMFVTDEPVWMTQLPAFYHYASVPLPGVFIGGRFPIDVWPRGMMWAFEWFDTSKPLVLKRGDPWFYVNFETMDPSRRVRLIEAEMTPELRSYANSIAGVTNYVNRTFSLFSVARQRRPKTLLTPKQR